MDSEEKDIEQLLKARSEIERELRRHKSALTIVFTDIVGSTSYFERYGDTAGIGMLDRHLSLVTQAFLDAHGRIIKTIGDSVMAEFPDPASAARAAVATQLALLEHNRDFPERERIQVRIGIHTGHGYRRDNDVFGDAVNVAARITKNTGAAQILVSSAVREALAGESDLSCNSQGKIAMAGKAEKEEVFEIVWTDPAIYTDLRRSLDAAKPKSQQVSPGHLEQIIDSVSRPTPGVTSAPALPGLPADLSRRFEILGQIGKGGMGVVYKARDRETGELVALKVINPDVADDPVQMERFKRETRLARKITHKNVCRIHEFGRIENTAYFTMELVSGENLRTILNRFGGLPLRKALDIARQVIAGLREAHAQGVVHRDLKPENIMLDDAGQVKVMDFGLARTDEAGLTRAGTVLGTPGFVSPEMIEGKPVDQRADIYALGAVLYEMLTGTAAFAGDTPIALAMNQLHLVPRPVRELEPGVPVVVEQAIQCCLEKEPDRRFATVDDLEAVLAEAEKPSGALPAIPAEALRPAGAQMPVWVIGTALGVGIVVLGGGGAYWYSRQHQPPAQTAPAAAPVQEQPPATEPPKEETPKEVAPEKTEPVKTAQAKPETKPAKKAEVTADRSAARPHNQTVQLECAFQVKQGSLTISSGSSVLFQDNLTGVRRSGGFLRLKSGFAGAISKPLTIPASAKEITVQVTIPERATPLTTKLAVAEAATLHVDVSPTKITAEFSKPVPAKEAPKK